MIASGLLSKADGNTNTYGRLISDVYLNEYVKSNYYRLKNNISGQNVTETDRDRASRYHNYLSSFFNLMTIGDIEKNMIKNITQYIKNLKNQNQQPLSASLQHRLWLDIKGFINFLYDMEFINDPIAIPFGAGIAKPKKKMLIESFNKEEFDKLISVIDDEKLKTFFTLLGECGPRKSEARGIKFKNVLFEKNRIEIFTQLKSNKERDVKLKNIYSKRIIRKVPESIMNDLKRYMDELRATGISESELLEEYIFLDKKGNPYNSETLRRKYKNYVKKAGIKYYPIHYLRHYYGTQAILRGESVPFVQDQMGHSRSDTTVLTHYVRYANDENE